MLYGTVTASFIVEDFGGMMFSKITRADVQKRYDELVAMLSLD